MHRDCYVFCDFETTGVSLTFDYPIEVGLVFVDRDIGSCQGGFESLVRPLDPGPDYEGAERIHGIPYDAVASAPTATKVATDINRLVAHHEREGGYDRFILVSDNIAFETHHMRKLFQGLDENDYPFHYSGRDLTILRDLLGGPSHTMPRDLTPGGVGPRDAADIEHFLRREAELLPTERLPPAHRAFPDALAMVLDYRWAKMRIQGLAPLRGDR